MSYKKRKKNSRMRGSGTHGRGTKRTMGGAGHRGGRGMAGSGKRAKHKKTKILKLYGHEYFGKRGFRRPQKVIVKIKAINISDLNKFKTKDINLTKLGFDTVLGKGEAKEKYNVTVKSCSDKAKKIIEKAGGVITLEK
jgi:large subunit ribosomal protein L15